MLTSLLIMGLANATTAYLEVEPQRFNAGEVVEMNLVLTGSPSKQIPTISIPSCRATYHRSSQAIRSINFHSERYYTYHYTLSCDPGEHLIGPVDVTDSSGNIIRAPGVRVKVGDQKVSSSSINASFSLDERDSSVLYVGQVAVYHFIYRYQEQILGARWTEPKFEGFTSLNIENEQKDYQIVVDGSSVQVTELHVPLLVTQEGKRELGPSLMTVQVAARKKQRNTPRGFESLMDLGFYTDAKTEVLTSNPIDLEVRPIPIESRPDTWDGLVGEFKLSAEVESKDIRVGDSVTLAITLEGNGQLSNIVLPPNESDSFRIYDDDPEIVSVLKNGEYYSKAIFRRALVPVKEGELNLPPIEISWFSPIEHRFVTDSIPAMVLKALPGETTSELQSFATSANRKEVASLGEDILPIHSQYSGDQSFDPVNPIPITFVLLPSFGLLYQSVRNRTPNKRKLERDKLLKNLENLPQNSAERLSTVDSILRNALAIHLGCPVGAVKQKLGSMEPEIGEILESLDNIRFAGEKADSTLETKAAEKARTILRRL